MKRPVDIHWHIYSEDQIRTESRGRLMFVLEFPAASHAPLLREPFDPLGRVFPPLTRERLVALLETGYSAVVYKGVNRGAIDELMAQTPDLLPGDPLFCHYNQQLLLNARYSLLRDPVRVPIPLIDPLLHNSASASAIEDR